jgi:hypothetical protein
MSELHPGMHVGCVLLDAAENRWRLATPQDSEVADGELAWIDEAIKIAFVRVAPRAVTVEMDLRTGSGPGGKPLRCGRTFGVKKLGPGQYRQAAEGEEPDCLGRLDAALAGEYVEMRACVDPTRGLVYVQESQRSAMLAFKVDALEAALSAFKPAPTMAPPLRRMRR